MTAQIGDSYSYKGGDYSIVAMSIPLRFDPRFYGFKPECVTTGCWNGYWCKYKISEDGIFLDKLLICITFRMIHKFINRIIIILLPFLSIKILF